MKFDKGEDSTFISEAYVRLTLFDSPVKSKTFDESPVLVARNVTSVSSVSSSEDEEEVHEVPPLRLSLTIPHPSVPPLFHQARVILNTWLVFKVQFQTVPSISNTRQLLGEYTTGLKSKQFFTGKVMQLKLCL